MATKKRLIDANTVYDMGHRTPFHIGIADLCDLKELLADVPTVDAVEVVHGRWVAVPSSDMMTGKAYKCSECKKMRYGSWMPNYCPNCGAKMDGDKHGS